MDQEAQFEASREALEPYDASDPAAINKARQKAQRRHDAEMKVVRGAMMTVEGRRYFYNLMAKCNTFMAPNSDNAHLDAKAIGRQQMGHMVLADVMESSADYFDQMWKENKKVD